jgi:L-aminopeptidase/D-esterase-like protein
LFSKDVALLRARQRRVALIANDHVARLTLARLSDTILAFNAGAVAANAATPAILSSNEANAVCNDLYECFRSVQLFCESAKVVALLKFKLLFCYFA